MGADILGILGVEFKAIGAESTKQQMDSVAESSERASKSFDSVAKSTDNAGINMKKLSFATFGAALSVTSMIQITNRYNNALTSIEAKQVQIARVEASIESQRLRLAKITKQYGENSIQAAIASDRLQASMDSLAVKQKELQNQQSDLNTMFLQFAVNITSSMLFSYVALREALKNVTLEKIKATFATKTYSAAQVANIGTTNAASVATVGLAGKLRILGASFQALFLAMGPIGWAMIGITAAFSAYMVYQKEIHAGIDALIGKKTELKKTVESTSAEFDEYMDSLEMANAQQREMFSGIDSVAKRMQLFREDIKSTTASINTLTSSIQTLNSGMGGGARAGMTPSDMSVTFAPDTPMHPLLSANTERFKALDAITVFDSMIQTYITDLQRFTKLDRKEYVDAMRERINLLVEIGALTKEQAQAEQMALSHAKAMVAQKEMEKNLEKEITSEKRQQVDLAKKAIKEAEELKKKLSATFGFLTEGENRRRFIAGETGYFTGESGIPFSGVIDRLTGGLLFQNMEPFNPYLAVQELVRMGEEMIKDGTDWRVVRDIIEPRIAQMLSGRGLMAGTPSLRDFLTRIQFNRTTGQIFGNVTIMDRLRADIERLGFRPNMSAGRRIGVGTGGGSFAGRSLATASGRSGRRGSRPAYSGLELFRIALFGPGGDRSTVERLDMQAAQLYEEMYNTIAEAGLAFPSYLFSQRLQTRDVSSRTFEPLFRLYEEAKKIITERHRRMVIEGLEARLGREERFAAHVGEFGLQSVMASGGTAVEFDRLIPLIQKAVRESMSGTEFNKYWDLAGVIKPTWTP